MAKGLATILLSSGTLFGAMMKDRRKRSNQYSYGKMEPRNLLATFSGTSGDDVVIVDFVDGRPAMIEMNGDSFENPDDTMTIELGTGRDVGNDDILFRGDDFNILLSGTVGNVNDGAVTFDYSEFATLRTGDGNDVIDDDGNQSNQDSTREIYTGGGDDRFVFNGLGEDRSTRDLFSVFLEDGDDQFVLNDKFEFLIVDGGAGVDHVDGSAVNFDMPTPTSIERLANVERISAAVPVDDAPNRFRIEGGSGFVIGTKTYVSYPGIEEPLELDNFNVFFGGDQLPANTSFDFAVFHKGELHIISTEYPTSAFYFETVSLGLSFHSGDTSGINHVVEVTDAEHLMISDSGSELGHQIEVSIDSGEPSKSVIKGLTGKEGNREPVYVAGIDRLQLVGSNTADDRFFAFSYDPSATGAHWPRPWAPQNWQLQLRGQGGNDTFVIAQSQREMAQRERVHARVNAIGGDGNDLVVIRDATSTEEELIVWGNWLTVKRDRSIYGEPEVTYDPDGFPIVNYPDRQSEYLSTVYFESERARFDLTDQTKRVYVRPSPTTRLNISGFVPTQGNRVVSILSPARDSGFRIDNGDNTYTWWWRNNYQLVYVAPQLS